MSSRNFVRKIKLAVFESDKNLKTEAYNKLRNMQYHAWQLANKIVQGQYFQKILPDVIVYNHPEDYEGYTHIQLQIGELKKLKKKSEEEKNRLTLLYQELKEFNIRYKDQLDAFRRNQSPQNFTYSLNGEEFRELLPSTIRATLNQKVFQEFKNIWKDFKNGSKKLISYRKDIAVPFQASAITSLKKSDEGFTFNLFGITFLCLLGKDGNDTTHIIDSLIKNDGMFKMCDSSYQIKDGELFLLLTLKTNVTYLKRNPNIYAGIDLGVTRMATMVIRDITNTSNTNYIERKFFGDKSFLQKVQEFYRRNRDIAKYTLGKTGKGRLHKIDSVQKSKNKWSNFRDNYNKKIAHSIIMRVIANNASCIIMEDLSGINDKKLFLKKYWAYFDLQTAITTKAKEYGIEVYKVEPAYTSQTCPACGQKHADNRLSQVEFRCINTECNYAANADVVGALNIINFNKNITEFIVS